MAEQLLAIDELDHSAQTTAVTDFAKFYIGLWQQSNLELISTYDHQHGYIDNINHELTLNQSFTPEERLTTSVNFNSDDYRQLLHEIGLRFYTNGHSEIPWSGWYQQQFAQLATA
ncbi:hypothetical protein [Furfurilactobacillus curtus]|uniref:Uncharacterized protein n=1 Tax=Furfurilactobacillus curtus TaxID=1746200 RepID=A0ABQ5JQ96_9LACO